MYAKVSRRRKPPTGGEDSKREQTKKRPRLVDAEHAMIAASEFCLFQYPTMFTGGLPRSLSLPDSELWIVPIVLTHPEHGVVGEAGLVAIDARTGHVIGSTPRNEVVAAGKRLREAKRDDLEAAFLQTRT